MRIRPYILAGGRSSRMGQDKATMYLGKHTLLGRVVETVRGVAGHEGIWDAGVVTVIGRRTELYGADRAIEDRFPQCGPMGGMEAALADLERGAEAEWAFFLPVDMPFISSGFIEQLLTEWIEAARNGAWVCHAEADGRPQPLVSLVHTAVRPFMEQELTAGRFKVTPVLQRAAQLLASGTPDGLRSGLHTTRECNDLSSPPSAALIPLMEGEEQRFHSFANLNTEEEFRNAETILAKAGSTP